jgi:hypothetical protein
MEKEAKTSCNYGSMLFLKQKQTGEIDCRIEPRLCNELLKDYIHELNRCRIAVEEYREELEDCQSDLEEYQDKFGLLNNK